MFIFTVAGIVCRAGTTATAIYCYGGGGKTPKQYNIAVAVVKTEEYYQRPIYKYLKLILV